ncbi:MAG: TetR family transcriptional regulator [Ilumatobacter sp.]|uniref:TetR family transcriptional regulator n=1 Tax=Ilumatobacter sp. TaxID=1967498 RepID=UPI0026215DEA|nr:TetR family transcriptional regulator [Ilumatobacter sp.]MDJ0770701.1 TetR family transcriptional regulator [Ilumatobacter sp.]
MTSTLTAEGAIQADDSPGLDTAGIVDAALEIVDRDGLEALTMRRLGSELGVEAMSIYHHIPNKAALLEAMVETMLPHEHRTEASSSPADLLADYAQHLRRTFLDHPNMAALAATRLPTSLFTAAPTAAARQRLVEFGFDDHAAAWILDSFVGFVIGHVLVQLTDGHATTHDDDAAFETGLRFLLIGLRGELGDEPTS